MQGGSKKHQHRTFSSLNTQGLILIKFPGHYELEPNFDVPFADIQRKIVSLLDTEKRRYTNPMEKSIDRIEYADSNLGLEWRVKHKKPNRPYSSYLTPAKNTPQRPATSKSFGGYGKQEVSPPQRAVSRRDARTDKFRSKLEIPSDYEEVYISKKPVSVKFPIKMTSPPRMSAAGKSKRLTTAQETGEVHLTRTNVLDSAETSEKVANRKYLFRSKRSAEYPSSHFELRSPQLRIHENSVTRSKSKPKTQEYKFKLGEPTRHPLETNVQLVKPKKASLRKDNSRDRSDDRVDRTTVLQQVPLNWITIHGVRSSLMQQEESSVHIRGEADSKHRQRIESKITVEILTEDQAEQHNQEQLQPTSSSETLKKTSNGKKLLKDSLDEPNEFRTSPGPFDRRAYNERKTLHAAMQQSRDTSHIRRGKDPSPFKLNRRSFQNRSASEQVGASQDASDDRTKHRDSMRAAEEATQNQMNSPTQAKRQGSPQTDSSKMDEPASRGRVGIPSQTSKRSVSPPEVLRVSPLRMRSPKEDDIFIVKPQNLQVSDASSPSEDPSPLTPVKFSARQHSLMIQPTDAMSEGLHTRPLTAQPKQAEESNNEAAQELKSSHSNKMRDGFAPFQESAVWGLSQFTDQVKIPIPPGRSTSEKNPIGLSSKQANPTTGPAPIAKVFEISALPKIQHCEDWKPRVILNERYYYSKPPKKEVSKPPGSSTLHHSGLSEDLYIVPSSWLCPLPIPPVSLVSVTAERWTIRVEKKELIQPTNNQQESPGIVSHLLEGHLSHSMDSPKKTRLHYLRSAIKDIQKHGYPFPSTSSTPKSMIKMVPVPPGANNSQPNTERGMMTGFQTPPMILITNPAAVGQYSGTTSRNSHRGQDSQEPIIDRTQGVLKIPEKKMFLKRVISLKDQPELLGPPQVNLQFSISGDSAAMSKKVYTNQAHGSQMEVSRFHPPTQNSEQPPNSAGRSINSAAHAQSGMSPGSLHSMGIGSKSSKTSLFNLIRENKLVSFLGKTENSRGGFVKPASDAYRQALRNEKHKILRKNVSLAQPKIVMKAFGDLRGIVVNTSSGASMNYNEDRITVLVKAHEKFEGLVQRGIQT